MSTKNTSTNLILAANDRDLEARFIAVAAEMGIDMAQNYVGNRMLQIAAQEVTSDGDTVASVYEYAVAYYKQRKEAAERAYKEALDELGPEPGKDTAAVTDAYIRAALTKLQDPTTD